jgi:hypothetical protein
VIRAVLAAWRTVALMCVAAAAFLPFGARWVSGPPGALVHVRWAPSVDASTRQRVEARLRLTDGQHLDGLTWQYDLVDPSSDAVRALVRDPAVEDTHNIDRSRFTLDGAERTTRRGRLPYGDALVAVADAVAVALGAVAALLTIVALSRHPHDRWASPRGQWLRMADRLCRAEDRLLPYALLTILGLAVYAVALWFPPTNGDDLSYLSSVATIKNPLVYFIQDHGHGNELYRPLTPVSLWLLYQVFGVWALPNQILNLALHITNVFLLYRLLQREQPDQTLAWLVAAVFMISQYTFLAATWTSDRPMLLTGLFVLLLVNHLRHHDRPVRLSSIAAFSVLALMSKESGLVVPAVALLFALMPGGAPHLTKRHRLNLAIMSASIILLYIGFRMLIFGSAFASYGQDGYLFLGSVRYQDINELPPLLRYLAFGENITKNALAPILPVFAEGGALLTQQSFLRDSPVIVSTALLFGIAATRRAGRLQLIALMILGVSAVAHFALFRLRLHYLSHAAFCLFVGGAPLLGNGRDHRGRTLVAETLAVIALVGGLLVTSDALSRQMFERNRLLRALPTDDMQRRVAEEEVRAMYR